MYCHIHRFPFDAAVEFVVRMVWGPNVLNEPEIQAGGGNRAVRRFFPYREAYERSQDTPQQEFIANHLLPELPEDFDALMLYVYNPDNMIEYLEPFSFSAMCAKQNNAVTGDVQLGK